MIQYICRDGHSYTIRPFLDSIAASVAANIRIITYEEIFALHRIRATHTIFADLDRLSGYELELAARAAEAIRSAQPAARILNHPARFLQRFELLDRLWREGINPHRAARLELGPPNLRYPVFLRREAEAAGPETGLLDGPEALALALASLTARGLPLRGRIAVEYCAEPDAAGTFRKYAAFVLGDRILPQHIQFSESWIVKRNTFKLSPEGSAEEMAYVTGTAHEASLRRICDIAGAGFGRIDYTLVGGKIVVFEINSNPRFPNKGKPDSREERRTFVRDRLAAAFSELDADLQMTPVVRLRGDFFPMHGPPGSWLTTRLWLRRGLEDRVQRIGLWAGRRR